MVVTNVVGVRVSPWAPAMKQKALCVSDTGSFFFTRHPESGRARPFPVFLLLRLLFPPSDSRRKPRRNRPSPRGSRPPIPRPLLPPPAPQSHVCASPGLTFFSCLSSPRPPVPPSGTLSAPKSSPSARKTSPHKACQSPIFPLYIHFVPRWWNW